MDGEDFYVNGASEFDGAVQFDSAATFSNMGSMTQPLNTENIGLPTVIKTTVPYTEAVYTVATVGAGETWWVHDVIVHVTEAYSVAGDDATFLVGDDLDVDGFIVLADADLQLGVNEYTGGALDWKGVISTTRGVYLDGTSSQDSHGHIYTDTQTIDASVIETTGATGDAGSADVYVIYTRLD